jgi:hypothetical protein
MVELNPTQAGCAFGFLSAIALNSITGQSVTQFLITIEEHDDDRIDEQWVFRHEFRELVVRYTNSGGRYHRRGDPGPIPKEVGFDQHC